MIRAADKWLIGYARSALRRPRTVSRPRHLVFCVADHFEPFRQETGEGATVDRVVLRRAALNRVQSWVQAYPALFERFRDRDGIPPRHTFFYPQEEYDADCIETLRGLCVRGLGEVEIHLHHRHDTPEGLARTLTGYRDTLRNAHGLLGSDGEGKPRFGFVHGNWALCNSRPDGKGLCGVNEELGVLRRAGCYADFTFPSAPSPTQPRTVNQLYYATDALAKPRGHDRGREVATAGEPGGEAEDSLLLVQGPLALDWGRRKWAVFPRLENGEISGANPPTPARIDLWVKQHIHARGRPDWVFVKVHTHGCVDRHRGVLLGRAMVEAHEHLGRRYNDGKEWRLHYATARELYNLIRAAEAGKSGSPGDYRDFEIVPPA